MLEFGSFQLDPDRRELRRDGKPFAVQAKLFDTLVLLAENRDRVVEKQELLDSVWPDVHVAESTLFQTISALRKLLGSGTANGDRYIATVPGRGYRFVAPAKPTLSSQVPRSTLDKNGTAGHRAEIVRPAQGSTPGSAPELTAPEPSKIRIENVERPPPAPTRGESLKPRAHPWRKTAAGLAVVLVMIVGVAFWISSESTPAEPANLRITRLTSLEGLEWQPGWSPDGRSFAYAGAAFGSADIFVSATAGGDPLRRTFDPADDLHPRWSPDGRYIAFLSDRGTGASVYVVSPYDGPERKLAETNLHRDVALLSGLGAQPWSPDSDNLLFPRRHADGGIAVWKIELSSGLETQITYPPPGTEDRDASWSFSGERIAFRGERDGKVGIWIADPGGQVQKLAADSGDWPAWAPDDRSLYVSSARNGPKNIWRVELDSGAWYQVTRGAGQDMFPSIAASGALAYSSFSHTLHIHRTYLSNGKSERLIGGAGRHLQASVSPHGTRIVYQSGRTGSPEIWVLDVGTGEERQLTFHPGAGTRPDWSPDGKEVVFLSRRDGAWRLWVVDAQGGAPRRLSSNSIPIFDMRTATIEGNAEPRWAPDGSRIGYIAPTEQGFAVWLASLDGKAEPIASTVGAVNFGWYLDVDHVILTRIAKDGVFELVAMNLVTGQQRVLHRGPHYELAAAPDGRAVSFSHNVSHVNQNLYVLRLTPPDPADGLPRPLGEPEQITDGKGIWHVHNGGWFPDGKSVVYTRDTDQADIFLVETR
jgi:Tol biopolymer transport system component/DNA-binding winged helix-turn-helix (wHTH) protein